MNRTAIEWTDYTFNPVTGCWGPGGTAEKPQRCAYCYAVGVAKRFYKGTTGDPFAEDDPFAPQFHPDRLSQPTKVKKPSKIFVCSMADLFGDWVPLDWIVKTLNVVRENPQHTFQFLTKNPERLKKFNPWPANCWVGTTVTNQDDADERLPWLLQVEAQIRFISHEPLLGPTDMDKWLYPAGNNFHPITGKIFGPAWAILGAQTGPGAVEPEWSWIAQLMGQYRSAGVPVFLKNNLPWPTEKIQEFPIGS